MQNAVLRFSLHRISAKTLEDRHWKHVNLLLQDITFIADSVRVVEEILLTERFFGEYKLDEPQFINSRMFISVFQFTCFPLQEYPDLNAAAKTLLGQFESIVYHVRHATFEPFMTCNFRERLLQFVRWHRQSINVDIPFLVRALAFRDNSHATVCTEKVRSAYLRNERSIDLYLGGIGHDSFIFGI